MKSLLILTTTLAGLVLSSSSPAQTYTFDPLHSAVVWQVSHFGFSKPSGKFFASGTLQYDPNDLKSSQVKANLNLNEGVTGIPDLDKHLKGKLFFNVEQYPTATFISQKVDVTEQHISKVHGLLTLHGVTKPITLDVKLNQVGLNPINDKESIGFSATTQLKRSDFGMTTMLPGIGDEVSLTIEVEASLST